MGYDLKGDNDKADDVDYCEDEDDEVKVEK